MKIFDGDSISIIGSSHIKNKTICQDSSDNYICEEYAIAIVCDGHGSSKHFRSDKGSMFATKIGIDVIKDFMRFKDSFTKDRKELLKQLEKNIILKWNESVKSDINKFPFEESELNKLSSKDRISLVANMEAAYGTTFIAFVMAEEYSFCIQIGDGDCAILKKDGALVIPIPEDDRLAFNVTTSLCDKKAIMDFRHIWMDETTIGAIITSDGVRNSFSSEEYYIKFCRSIFESYSEVGSIEAGLELRTFMPRLTQNGSGDDISISIIYDTNKLPETLGISNSESKDEKSYLVEGSKVIKKQNDSSESEVTENSSESLTLGEQDEQCIEIDS